MKFIVIDKKTEQKSNPINIDWFLFGDEDLEFENGDTLPLNDFKFFRKDFTIEMIVEQKVKRSVATKLNR